MRKSGVSTGLKNNVSERWLFGVIRGYFHNVQFFQGYFLSKFLTKYYVLFQFCSFKFDFKTVDNGISFKGISSHLS